MNRFSEYRVMWILVFFDLPTETKKTKKRTCFFASICKLTALRCFSSQYTYAIVQAWKMLMHTLNV